MRSNERHLRRQDGLVGGVCGGLGAFFGINPWWFRLLFLVLMMPGGLPGVVPYLLLWIIIPRKRPVDEGGYGVEYREYRQ
jgi:phage shock protein C